MLKMNCWSAVQALKQKKKVKLFFADKESSKYAQREPAKHALEACI